ncbi:MAG: hypothetical protein ABWK01_01570 [Infirmifilum sp.]
MWVLALAVSVLAVASACCSPEDRYAVEVVLNKPGVSYDLSLLAGATEVSYAGGLAYAFRSHYDPRLVVLLSEQEVPVGRYLAVRVQVPVSAKTVSVYRCKLPMARCGGRIIIDRVVKVSAGSGEETIDLGFISFEATAFVTFRPALKVVEGNANLTISGVLTLEGAAVRVVTVGSGGAYNRTLERGGGGTYRVPMPCLLSLGEPCFRTMVLIPGYDVPLRIEEGAYRAKLTLAWRSTGRAKVAVEALEIKCEGVVLPQPLPSAKQIVKEVGGATIRVDLENLTCEVLVPSEVGVKPEVERALRELLATLNLSGVELPLSLAGAESLLVPAIDIGEEAVLAALKAELEWLIKSGVVRGLSSDDVSSIVAAAKLGYAGCNNRLILHEGRWVPYSSVFGASPTECAAGVEGIFVYGSRAYEELRKAEVAARSPQEAGRWGAAALALAVAALTGFLAYVAVKRILLG